MALKKSTSTPIPVPVPAQQVTIEGPFDVIATVRPGAYSLRCGGITVTFGLDAANARLLAASMRAFATAQAKYEKQQAAEARKAKGGA